MLHYYLVGTKDYSIADKFKILRHILRFTLDDIADSEVKQQVISLEEAGRFDRDAKLTSSTAKNLCRRYWLVPWQFQGLLGDTETTSTKSNSNGEQNDLS